MSKCQRPIALRPVYQKCNPFRISLVRKKYCTEVNDQSVASYSECTIIESQASPNLAPLTNLVTSSHTWTRFFPTFPLYPIATSEHPHYQTPTIKLHFKEHSSCAVYHRERLRDLILIRSKQGGSRSTLHHPGRSSNGKIERAIAISTSIALTSPTNTSPASVPCVRKMFVSLPASMKRNISAGVCKQWQVVLGARILI